MQKLTFNSHCYILVKLEVYINLSNYFWLEKSKIKLQKCATPSQIQWSKTEYGSLLKIKHTQKFNSDKKR